MSTETASGVFPDEEKQQPEKQLQPDSSEDEFLV
jgi:hypothetical protein